MATPAQNQPKWTLQQVLEAAKTLTLAEQQRLQEELKRFSDVQLDSPDRSPEAQDRGPRLAKQIRAELKGKMQNTLDDTMASLRGRSWLS